MIYGSVCSGIEAASVAWHPLGWRPAFFSEIEKFHASVLAARWPDVPNFGDFTSLSRGETTPPPIELLVGGTPCQSFSISGLRGGLADARGNLALEFLRLVDRARPRWVVWENVPGVLSSLSHDAPDPRPPSFGMAVDARRKNGDRLVVADEYDADETHAFACFVAGLSELGYGVAWRVLDSQYFGVAQRRNRVFVVGCLGAPAAARAVLFERASLRGDPAPSRAAREDVAGPIGSGAKGRGWSDDFERSGAFIPEIAPTLTASHDASTDGTDGHKGVNNQTPLVAFDLAQITSTTNRSNPAPNGPAPTISKHSRMHVASFNHNQGSDPTSSMPLEDERVGTLPTHHRAHAVLIEPDPLAFHATQDPIHGAVAPAIGASDPSIGVVTPRGLVRRLTPREYERLFGFPDDYTAILGAADGPRYRALGNTMVVDVMRWIGKRIDAVDAILQKGGR